MVDSGATRSVVRKEFVCESAYTGNLFLLAEFEGSKPCLRPLAKVKVEIGPHVIEVEAAVSESIHEPVILGWDIGARSICALGTSLAVDKAEKKVH